MRETRSDHDRAPIPAPVAVLRRAVRPGRLAALALLGALAIGLAAPATAPVAAAAAAAVAPAYGAAWSGVTVPAAMTGGTVTAVAATITNTGSQAWPAGGATPVRLSYHWRAADGAVAIYDGQRTALAADVAPGGSATRAVQVLAPATSGDYTLVLDLVQEGVTWFGERGVATVSGPVRVGAAPLALRWGAASLPTQLRPGTTGVASVTVTNAGTQTWAATGSQPVRLSYHWFSTTGATVVYDGQRALLDADVPAGGTVTFPDAWVQAPAAAGTYTLAFDLVQEGVTWFGQRGAAPLTASVGVQAAAPPPYAVAWSGATLPTTLAAGTLATGSVTITNTGSQTWSAGGTNPVRLAYHWRSGATSVAYDGIRTNLAADVAPGASVTLPTVAIRAPGDTGTYTLALDLVQEGVTWFSQQGATTQNATVVVTAAAIPQLAARWSAVTVPTTMRANAVSTTGAATVTNTGSAAWSAAGQNPVNVSYHWLTTRGDVVTFDGERTHLAANVAAGGSTTVSGIRVVAPATVGTYTLVLDLVQEGVSWFSLGGGTYQTLTVTVTN